jgi:hypothetical protein
MPSLATVCMLPSSLSKYTTCHRRDLCVEQRSGGHGHRHLRPPIPRLLSAVTLALSFQGATQQTDKIKTEPRLLHPLYHKPTNTLFLGTSSSLYFFPACWAAFLSCSSMSVASQG